MPDQPKRHGTKHKFNPYDDDYQPEFQVAPMVDVLLVLLLFFMATATTEVLVQAADLKLPDAKEAKDKEKNAGQLVINVEKLNFQIKINDQYYKEANDIIPVVRAAREEDAKLRGDATNFRILIRADEQTSYSVIRDIMKACGKAGVANVTFAVSKGGEGS
jgi:biopolymer transport protein ExbD